MIPWKMQEEKEMVAFYATMLDDKLTLAIIEKNEISSKLEALHFAEFFWKMVQKSNEIQYEGDAINCEYLLEKVIITLMAYFRSSGYEEEWEQFSDL